MTRTVSDKLKLTDVDPSFLARQAVVNEFNNDDNTFYKPFGNTKPVLAIDDTRMVLFAYILGGWKATIITTLPDHTMYEVTYNASKDEVYVGTWVKKREVTIVNNGGGRRVTEL